MKPTDKEEREIGERLVKVLGLKPYNREGESFSVPVYLLGEGYSTKTALGVYRTIQHIIKGES